MSSDQLYAEVQRLRRELDAALQSYVAARLAEGRPVARPRRRPLVQPHQDHSALQARMLAEVNGRPRSYADLAATLHADQASVVYVAQKLVKLQELERAGWGKVRKRNFDRKPI